MIKLANQPVEDALESLLSDREVWERIVTELKLAPQQERMARLILRGKQVKEIAATLDIKKSTADTYLHRIYSRCQVEDKTQLAIRVFSLAWHIAKNEGRICNE